MAPYLPDQEHFREGNPMQRSMLAAITVAAAAALVLPATAAQAATRTLTITAVSKAMSYGGSDPALTYAVSGLVKGDALTRTPTCTVPSHKAVGTYPITCSGAAADAKKYTLRYVTGSLVVVKAPLGIYANYTQKSYVAANPTSFGYTVVGLAKGDKLTTVPTCAVDGPHVDAGRYVISCSGADAGANYAIRYFDQYYDITKSPLLVGPYRQTAFYGSPAPEFTYAVNGLKSGESLTKEPTCGVEGEHEHAGTYTIECTGATATDNYDLYVVDNEYTVLQTASLIKGEKPSYTRNLLLQPTGVKLVATLAAYLDSAYRLLPDATVTFTSGDAELCTATTDSAGRATCTLGKTLVKTVQTNGYTVSYAGTDDIGGSSHEVAPS